MVCEIIVIKISIGVSNFVGVILSIFFRLVVIKFEELVMLILSIVIRIMFNGVKLVNVVIILVRKWVSDLLVSKFLIFNVLLVWGLVKLKLMLESRVEEI